VGVPVTVPRVKRAVLRLLDRLHLLGFAFRSYERVQSVRAGSAEGEADDGLPVPPAGLRVRVAGTADLAWFLEGGRLAEQSIRDALGRHGRPLDNVETLLDFGCGCGRVTRRFAERAGVHGSDTNAEAIDWCRRNLSFARCETNALEPPLVFADASFDLVYGLSVFTHLTIELQRAWLDELARVLRPGGLLILTTHGDAYVDRLDERERSSYERGEVVVRWERETGTNLCGAYHPRGALAGLLPPSLAFLELDPEGAMGNPRQDVNVIARA
jgi:SAM-dependent methyltransferase